MVADLQTLAAADAAALNLARSPCDLADLAAAAADSLARRFEAAGLTLDRRLAASRVLADPHWLHQVITNLLTNALKFTLAGGHVTISTGLSRADAILRVTDTGTGIPADDLPRIFDRFWRGQRAAQVSGSGIGLAVAAELAQAHGRLVDRSQRVRGPRARHRGDAHPAQHITTSAAAATSAILHTVIDRPVIEPAVLGVARVVPVVMQQRRVLAAERRQGQVKVRAAREPDDRAVVGIGVQNGVAVPQEDAQAALLAGPDRTTPGPPRSAPASS